MRKLLQFPSRPAVVYLHFWAPTYNTGQWSFWNHTVQPGAQHPTLPYPPFSACPDYHSVTSCPWWHEHC